MKTIQDIINTKKERFELSSHLIMLNEVCTYSGYGNPEWQISADRIEEDIIEGYFEEDNIKTVDDYWDLFDYKEYTKQWFEHCFSVIEEQIIDIFEYELSDLEINLKLEYKEFFQPKYYNFKSDSVNIDFIISEEDLLKLFYFVTNEENKDTFAKFLKENYTSCSGFISFTPNNIQELSWKFREGNIQSIAAIFAFVISEYIDRDSFIDSLNNNELYYTEFITNN